MNDGAQAFEALIEPHRRSITLHCYRMLGSLQDAEELTQEALLRAWQRREDVRSAAATRAWLYRIATNVCLDHLRKVRRRRALPHGLGPPASVVRLGSALDEQLSWIEPAPNALLEVADDAALGPDAQASRRESIGLAFITALQLLSPKQRAALLLVDVLGWTPQETAALLETTVPSVNSLLQRSRRNVEASADPGAWVETPDEGLLGRFIRTWESGDVAAFAALLAEDALLSMPPQPEWYSGREAIAAFMGMVWREVPGVRRLVPVAASGGVGVAVYRDGAASAIVVMGGRGGRVRELVRFGAPHLFGGFGLPARV